MNGADTLAGMVKKADPDRYTATLYAPPEKRLALFALYAFNAELARIRNLTSEPVAGEMRLRWWLDTIAAGNAGDTAGHPVADTLKEAIAEYGLPVTAFENMADARRFDLYNDTMPSRNDLEGYCGETAGALIQLASMVLDKSAAQDHGAAAGHAGCAHAIAGMLSMLPLHRSRGQCFFPLDLLLASGATVENVRDVKPGKGVDRAVAAMIALGREHMTEFEKLAPSLPSTLRPAYLPAASLRAWYRSLERAGSDVFERHIKPPPLAVSFAVLRRAMFGWR